MLTRLAAQYLEALWEDEFGCSIPTVERENLQLQPLSFLGLQNYSPIIYVSTNIKDLVLLIFFCNLSIMKFQTRAMQNMKFLMEDCL